MPVSERETGTGRTAHEWPAGLSEVSTSSVSHERKHNPWHVGKVVVADRQIELEANWRIPMSFSFVCIY